MAKKKDGDSVKVAAPPQDPHVLAAYELAVEEYAGAIKLIQDRAFDKARPILEALAAKLDAEPELAERVRCYLRLCGRKLDANPVEATTPEDLYHLGVCLANNGDWEKAVQLLDQALLHEPGSARVLYARACAWALQGKADRAVADLRDSIAADPVIRFQAVNDPDFERIREEPAFIDIIEPSPAGA